MVGGLISRQSSSQFGRLLTLSVCRNSPRWVTTRLYHKLPGRGDTAAIDKSADAQAWHIDTIMGKPILRRAQSSKSPKSSPSPLVILLGWHGANVEKHLTKYSELYERKGFMTISTVAPSHILFSPRFEDHKKFGQALLKYLQSHQRDIEADKRRIIFHVFSNGGVFPLLGLYRYVQSQEHALAQSNDQEFYKRIIQQVAGVVYDSSPCYVTPDLAAAVAMEALGSESPFIHKLMAQLFRAGLSLFPDYAEDYWRYCRGLELGPELYLYSPSDRICNVSKLQSLLEDKKRLRAPRQDISEVVISDASHVQL